MDFLVFAAVLAAALLHATWNVLVKVNLDRFLALFLIHALMGLFGLGVLAISGLPVQSAWPFALASGVLHTGYNVFLARSYRSGEMSLVYPVARGAAPVVSLILSLLFAGDVITVAELGALAILIAGLWLVAAGRTQQLTDTVTLLYALGTAGFIGLYTVVDGMGARASGDALAYSGLIFVFDGLFIFIIAMASRGTAVLAQVRPFLWRGAAGAVCSSLGYGIVIWAMTKAPIAMVAALRETSILFVLAMSALVLKEKLSPMRLLGGALIVAGAAALRFA